MEKRDYDAVVVGAGPNGLAAAITLQRRGLSVLLMEAKSTIGGGMRTAELILPGHRHDICSAVHPMAAASPFFRSLPLTDFGLELLYPEIAAAHPFDNGSAVCLYPSLKDTAAQYVQDRERYEQLLQPLLRDWPQLLPALLGPLSLRVPLAAMARFGSKALRPATAFARQHFVSPEMRALFAGMAAHAIQPLTNIASSAIGLVLLLAGHDKGWPIPKGGSQRIADAMGAYFNSLGGTITTDIEVRSLAQLPSSHAVLLDVTPRQLLSIAGHSLSPLYRTQLQRYRYGMGVYKIDWILDGPVPFTAPACQKAGTVHLGNTLEEITVGEEQAYNGKHPEKPFVLLAQPSVADVSRAPEGRQVVWAYCHVPHGSKRNMTEAIERQVERFAPGFKERIIGRHTMDTAAMEQYNANYVGGDINGGVQDLGQLFTRPALRCSPYRTSAKGIYLCSSSTPPGGGVHGMCGYHAAERAWRDIFKNK